MCSLENDVELKDLAETSQERSNVYGLLAVIYRTELKSDLLKQITEPPVLQALSDLGVQFENDFLQKAGDDLLEDLAVEYARLFIGPGKHISPHESVHHQRDDGQCGLLWGMSTVEVKKFIESTGLEYKSDYQGLPDHISVELEFMRELLLKEGEAWRKEDKQEAIYFLKIEKKFMEEHLSRWIPEFCDKVISEAQLSFYREIARLTKSFLELEIENIAKQLVET